MKVVTLDQIKASKDRPAEFLATPEWGEDTGVYIRAMSARARDAFEMDVSKSTANFRAKFAIEVCHDEDGHKLFDASSVDVLSEKSCAVLDRILEVGTKLGKFSSKDMATLEKT